MLTNFVLAWLLLPEQKGAAALLVVVPNLIVVFASLGFNSSGVYFSARDDYSPDDILSTTLFLTISISLCLGLGFAIFFTPLQQYLFRGIGTADIILSLLTIPGTLWLFYIGDIFWALKKKYAFMWIRVGALAIYFIGAIVFVGWAGAGIRGAIIAYLLGVNATTAISFLLVGQMATISLVPNRALLRASWRYGSKAHLIKVAQQGVYRLDTPILNYFGGSAAVGFYSIAIPLAELVWHIPRAVGFVLFPTVAAMKDKSQANNLTTKMVKHTTLLSLFFSFFIVIGTWVIVTYMLPNYYATFPLVLLLLPGVVMANVFQLITTDLLGRANFFPAIGLAIAGFLVGIFFYFSLIPWGGASGAALGSTLAYFSQAILALFVWHQTMHISLREFAPSWQDVSLYKQLWLRVYRQVYK